LATAVPADVCWHGCCAADHDKATEPDPAVGPERRDFVISGGFLLLLAPPFAPGIFGYEKVEGGFTISFCGDGLMDVWCWDSATRRWARGD
jgi:hypothetical protein